MARFSNVVLVVPHKGLTKSLSVEHATRLLRMKNNGGWKIHEDSKHEFVNGSIRIKQDKGDITSTSKDKRGKKSQSS